MIAPPLFHENDEEWQAKRDWNPFLWTSWVQKALCTHYWIEIDRECRGLIGGTVGIWACVRCNEQISKPLGEIPLNPLHYESTK